MTAKDNASGPPANGADLDAISILIVDDEPANTKLLERILTRAGFNAVQSTNDPHAAVENAFLYNVDIVLLDLHMPGKSGFQVMSEINGVLMDFAPLIVILTGDDTRETKAQALAAGAKDFISKPFDNAEVVLRVRNLADLRLMHKRLHHNNLGLEEKVRARTIELEEARLDVIDRLAKAAEFRDDDTGQHTRRVGAFSARLARALGLPDADIGMILRAAPLHDVGKIAVPDGILLKPGPLNDDEFRMMQRHTTVGAELLSGSRSSLLELASEIALSHHERWDAGGYPRGLGETDIPRFARIVALADFFDAISHDRAYRKGYAMVEVVALIRSERARHFDPEVVDAFLTLADQYDLRAIATTKLS